MGAGTCQYCGRPTATDICPAHGYVGAAPPLPAETIEVPPGVIWMWYGATADIPNGWALCDGTNGTPPLSNTFIYGSGTNAIGTEKHVEVTLLDFGTWNLHVVGFIIKL